MAHGEKELRNLDLCDRMYRDMLFAWNPDLIDDFLAEDYVQHSTAASGGREGLRAFMKERIGSFPDVRQAIKARFADGDFTIYHIHTVRHAGDPGMSIMDVFRIEEDRVKEHWEVVQEIPESLPHANGIF